MKTNTIFFSLCCEIIRLYLNLLKYYVRWLLNIFRRSPRNLFDQLKLHFIICFCLHILRSLVEIMLLLEKWREVYKRVSILVFYSSWFGAVKDLFFFICSCSPSLLSFFTLM